MAITTRVNVSVSAAESASDDLGSASFTHALSLAVTIATGTGTSQADRCFSDTRSLNASATEDLDLAGSLGGKLVGIGSGAVVFAEVILLMVKASSANTNNVQVTRSAANGAPIFMAAGDGVALLPGGVLFLYQPGATGIAVTGGTGDLLTITNSGAGTTVSYDILILGRSA